MERLVRVEHPGGGVDHYEFAEPILVTVALALVTVVMAMMIAGVASRFGEIVDRLVTDFVRLHVRLGLVYAVGWLCIVGTEA